MNSEKVKEIKKALEFNANEDFCFLPYIDDKDKQNTVEFADILTLINELESENERLSKELDSEWKDRRKAEEDLHKAQWHYKIGLSQSQKRNKELKDRIAELEKQLTNDRVFYKDGICYPINCQGTLKQFAKRLKEDFTKKKNKLIKEREIATKYDDFILIDALAYKIDELQYAIDKIDKTLKEFIDG